MTSLYQDIRGALQQLAATASGFPPANQRAYEGVTFSPTVGTAYAQMTLMPTQGRPFSVSAATKQHTGLFQVSVYVPSNAGTAAAEIAADAVKAVFNPGGPPIPNGAEKIIIDYAERASKAMEGPDFIWCPVTVRWRCFSSRN